NSPWSIGMIFLGRNVTDMLRSVAGRMTSRQDQRSKLEFITVLHRLTIEAVLRAAFTARVNFRRAGAIGQFARAAHQVGVNVGFENVRDRDAVLARRLEINFDVRSRIDYRSGAFLVIADQI